MEDLGTVIFLIIGLAFIVCWFLAWKKIFTKLEDIQPTLSAILMFFPLLNILVILLTGLRLTREEKDSK